MVRNRADSPAVSSLVRASRVVCLIPIGVFDSYSCLSGKGKVSQTGNAWQFWTPWTKVRGFAIFILQIDAG
jgi:hypothetical protein